MSPFEGRRRRREPAAPPEPLPEDLARLGEILAAAAERELARRSSLRRRLATILSVGALGVPFALALAPAELGPAVPLQSAVAAPLIIEEPGHIRDEAPPPVRPSCLDGRDCPVPEGADLILVLPESLR